MSVLADVGEMYSSETHEVALRVENFARERFFFKMEIREIADCLAATILMYYDEISLYPYQVEHDQVFVAAASMSLRAATHAESKEWGRIICKQFFVLDKLLAPYVEYVK